MFNYFPQFLYSLVRNPPAFLLSCHRMGLPLRACGIILISISEMSREGASVHGAQTVYKKGSRDQELVGARGAPGPRALTCCLGRVFSQLKKHSRTVFPGIGISPTKLIVVNTLVAKMLGKGGITAFLVEISHSQCPFRFWCKRTILFSAAQMKLWPSFKGEGGAH